MITIDKEPFSTTNYYAGTAVVGDEEYSFTVCVMSNLDTSTEETDITLLDCPDNLYSEVMNIIKEELNKSDI